LQPTSANAAQTMRINFFIALVFFTSIFCYLTRFLALVDTIRHKALRHNTVKPCFENGKEPPLQLLPSCA
jgi:hypothetical protein